MTASLASSAGSKPPPPIRVSAREAATSCLASLLAAGVPPCLASVQARALVEAELRGHPSHGLLRLPRIIERIRNGVADPIATGVQRWLSDACLEVDGARGLGPIVGMATLETLIPRARRTGVAMATVRSAEHLGMLALYAERVVAEDLIGIIATTSEALVHVWGGRERIVGTNPLAIGIPTKPPLVLDMATSAISMGEVLDRAARGVPLERDTALDQWGDPTTDATAAAAGSIAPFGGPKGSGLGLALEALIGVLTRSSFGRDVVGTLDDTSVATKGDLFLVLRPAGLSVIGAATDYLAAVRSSARQDPSVPLCIPGDGARMRRAQALRTGFDVPRPLWCAINALPMDRARAAGQEIFTEGLGNETWQAHR